MRKSRKVSSDTNELRRVSRIDLEYTSQHQKSHRLQDLQKPKSNRGYSTKRMVDLAICKNLIREYQLRFLRRTVWTSSLSKDTNRGKQTPEERPLQTLSIAETCDRGAGVVESKHRPTVSNPPQRSNDVCKYGRGRSWMGSHSKWKKPEWALESDTAQMAQQSEGAMDNLAGIRNKRRRTSRTNDYGADGQQDGCSVHNKGGRDQVPATSPNYVQNLSTCRSIPNTSDSPLSARPIQPHCRQSFERKRITRMDVIRRHSESDISKIRQTLNRPVRKQTIGCGKELCQRKCRRPELCVCGRIQSTVEFQTGLGFSATSPSTTCSASPREEQRSLPICSTQMGEDFLEGRAKTTRVMSTNDNMEQPETPDKLDNRQSASSSQKAVFAGLENSGWSNLTASWPDEDKKLLESSWRKSTLKTYKPAWERWQRWSEKHCNTNDPEASDLAKFICFLHTELNLAPRTIAVHKSVVTMFANPTRTSELSNHPLVRQALKAVALSKPPPQKPRTWEVTGLIEYLRSYNIDVNSLFQVSRHVAVLLLLATGRRIHDLTLLDISSDSLEIVDGHLILWPKFGSKTDCATFRQSGWKFSPNDVQRFDLVHWIQVLISIAETRRSSRDQLTSLFITTRGKVGSASRTVIAGWIRTIFKDAHIYDTPGSFRSAVNSANWKNYNLDLDEILKRGNWKRRDTFLKYYYKETESRQSIQINTNNIANCFSPL